MGSNGAVADLMTSTKRPGLTILNAKLNRPRVTKDLIVRPRLLALLDESLTGPLSIVVAPAGFGKSTLVSSWLEELDAGERRGLSPVPAAWLTLDESDSNINVFLHYFINALRKIFPGAAPKTMVLLTARQQPPLTLLTGTLSNEIEAFSTSFVMVLDETHALHDQEVFDFLTVWLRYWPRPMHLILVSRRNPPLPLTKLRANGKLIEIRSHDLRFTADETAEFLSLTLGRPLEASVLETLYQQLEGWITGLKLVTLSPGVQENLAALPQVVLDGDMHITDYLVEEVLQQQPTRIQRFLLKISINREICESLGKALLGDPDPDCDVRQCLNYLETHELFLTPLDNRHEWYSLHQVFRDLLQRKLQQEMGEEVVRDLHSRAAGWYAMNDQLDQALHHALEAKNLVLATQIMAQGIRDVLNRTDRPMLERWLQMLPNEVIFQQPELLIMQGWHHALRWELDQALSVSEQAEALLDEAKDRAGTDKEAILRGQIAMMKGQAAYFSNQPQRAVDLCREALTLMPKDWHYVRGASAIFLGISLYSGGHAAEAEQFLSAQYEAAADKAGDYALRVLLALALNSLQSGRFETARRTAQVMSAQSKQYGHALHQGWSHYLLGYIHFQLNELKEAERHYLATIDLRYTTQLLIARNGMVGLAAVYKAQGKDAAATTTIDDLSRFDIELYGRELISTTAARARLLLRQDDLEGADRYSKQIELPPRDRPLLPWIDEPLLTRVAVLIACNTPADIEAALNALDVLDEIALRTHSTRSRVEILALRALAQLEKGDVSAARHSLIQSVELARRTGHIRVYVDLGLPMQNLLGQIAAQRTVAKTVSRILAAFEAAGGSDAMGTTIARPINQDGNRGTAVGYPELENLTSRELEVLTLMAEPISFAEISEQLHIALSTTKRHSINLYEKLGVHSRWEAVAAAVELGILSPR